MASINGLDDFIRSLIRVSSDRIRNGRNSSDPCDHGFQCRASVCLAQAACTLMFCREEEAAGHGGTKRAWLHDENFDAEGIDLLSQRLVYGFNGEFASRVSAPSGAGYESETSCYKLCCIRDA